MSIQINVDPNIQHLIKGFEKGINQFNSRASSKAKLKVGIDEKSFTRPLGRITGQVNMFESAMEAANARVVAFGASTAVLATVTKVLKDIVKTSIEVEAAFADINRILGLTSNQFEKFGNQLFDTAQKTASSFQAASAAALEFSRQGLKTEEVLKRTSDALTLVRLTGINAEKAVGLLTATVNAFTDLDTTSAVNKFVAVETKFAVAARDLVEGLSRVGSAAQDAKVDFDELNALITAVQQTTGRGGAVIGNALKTIFTRLQRESTLESLERFNVTVRDVQGNILPATQVLSNFAAQYDKLADSTQAYLREQVAGVFQANILSAILKDLNKEYSVTAKALDVSKNATNEAEQANFKLNQTLSALLQNTGTEFAKLQKTLGDEAFLGLAKSIVSSFGSVISGINNLLDPKEGSTIAKGFLKGFANVLQGPVLVGALKVLFNVAKQSFGFLTQALPVLLNITTASAKRAQTEEFINKLLSSDVKLAQQIYQAEGNQAKQLELILNRSRAITAQFERQRSLSSGLSKTIVGEGSFITGAGLRGSVAQKAKNKAGGYMPSIRAEQSAISRGVGGAGNGAYPVVIPNFAFGGGKVGPVVANSSEVMVPNYGGSGGSAIFNQDMISAYGMPAGAVPIAAYGYNTKLSKVAKGNLRSISKRNKNINANDMLKNGYDAEFGLEGFPAFEDQSEYRSKKKYGEAYEDFVLNEFRTGLSGFSLTGSGKNWKSAHDFYRKDNSAIDLVKLVGNRITAMAEVKGGGLDKAQTLNKPSRFIGENLLDPRVGSMFRTPAGENVKVKTLLVTNLNKPADTSGIVKGANGYIPYLASGRVPLSSLTSAANISKASANNPNIYPEDLVKTGYDNHFSLPVRTTMRRGMSAKTYGDKVEAEMAKNPKIKSMGYRLAHGGELHGKGNSAVDLIKTEGNVLTGVMEIKGGKVDSGAALKTGRVISENLSRPLVAGMFQGGPGKKIPYETHLVTNARRNIKPQNMAGMMRKGATMAGGYVPNFAKGRQIEGYMVGTGNMPKNIQSQIKSRVDRLVAEINAGLITMDQFNDDIKNIAVSSGMSERSMKKFANQAASMATNTQKANTQSKGLVAKMKGLADSPGASLALLSVAPMVAGIGEQMITGGASRIDQTAGQRFAGSAVSNVTSFATSGAMIGGLPGAVVGGLIGLGKAAMDTSLSLEELKEKAEDYDKTTGQVTSAAEQFIQAQKDIVSASSDKELIDAQKRASSSLQTLRESGDDLYQSFYKGSGSIDTLVNSLARYEKKRAIGTGLLSGNRQELQLAFRMLAGEDEQKVTAIRSLPKSLMSKRTELFERMQAPVGDVGTEKQLADKLKAASELRLLITDTLSDLGAESSEISSVQNYISELKGGNLREYFNNFLDGILDARMPALTDDQIAQRELAENFALLKDKLIQESRDSILNVRVYENARQLESGLFNIQSTLYDSLLDPLTATALKFEEKSKALQFQIDKSYDDFYQKNINNIIKTLETASKGSESQNFISNLLSTMRGGGDIKEFGPEAARVYQAETGPDKAARDLVNNLIQERRGIEQANQVQETLLIQQNKIDTLRAQNLSEELENNRIRERIESQRSLNIKQEEFANNQSERLFNRRLREISLEPATERTRMTSELSLTQGRLTERTSEIQNQRDLAEQRLLMQREAEMTAANRDLANAYLLEDPEEGIARAMEKIGDIEQKYANQIAESSLQFENSLEELADELGIKIDDLKRAIERSTPGFKAAGLGMTDAFNKIQSDTDSFSYKIGYDIPLSFQNNMVNALNTAMDRADDLGDALRNAAVGFLTEIRNAFTQQAVGQIMTGGKMMFDSFGPQGQVGGYIKAQNGMYISGGRTGDRNPALLEDGEYVLNRNAVRALGGPRAIDQLNFGMAPRFQSGGSAFVNEDAMSSRMSGLFLTGDSPELAERRQQIEASIARRAARGAKRKQLTNAIISTLAMGAVSGVMSAGFGKASSESAVAAGSGAATDTSDAFYTSPWAKYAQNGGYISRGPRNIDSVPAFMAGGEYVMNNKAVKKYGLGFMSRLNGGYIPRYQSGGSVAETAAGSLGNMGSNTNNVSINVNMGANGQPQASAAMVGSTGDQQSAAQSKELGKRIESAVLQVIQKEQRVGGLLSGGSTKRG